MDFLDKAEKFVAQTGQEIGRQAGKLAETARLKSMIHTCEEVIEINYRQIGKAYYEANKDREDCEFGTECRAVTDAMHGMEELKGRLEELSIR